VALESGYVILLETSLFGIDRAECDSKILKSKTVFPLSLSFSNVVNTEDIALFHSDL